MTHVALYARVSHDDKVQDPEVQLSTLRSYCKRMGWTYDEYSDKQTGRNINRPNYQRMLASIEKYDGVVIEYPDRLTREGPERGIQEIQNILDRNKFFEISAAGMQIHGEITSTMKLNLRILFTVAAFQSDLISDKTREGMKHKRPESGWSWQKVTPGIIREVMDYHTQGLSIRMIERQVNGISRATINRIIKENL